MPPNRETYFRSRKNAKFASQTLFSTNQNWQTTQLTWIFLSLSFTLRTPFEVPAAWGHTWGELFLKIAKQISGPDNTAKSAWHCPKFGWPLKRKNTSQANLLQLVIRSYETTRLSSPLVSQFGEQCPQIAKPISGSEKMQNSQVKPYFQTIKTNKLLNSSESFWAWHLRPGPLSMFQPFGATPVGRYS